MEVAGVSVVVLTGLELELVDVALVIIGKGGGGPEGEDGGAGVPTASCSMLLPLKFVVVSMISESTAFLRAVVSVGC